MLKKGWLCQFEDLSAAKNGGGGFERGWCPNAHYADVCISFYRKKSAPLVPEATVKCTHLAA